MLGTGADHANARAAIIDAIRTAGMISRVEIVHATRLTGATVSNEVRRLLDEGLVVEAGRAASTGGKPRMLLRMVPTSRYAVGIHLDHDGLTYVLLDLGGAIVARYRQEGVGADPDAVVGEITLQVERVVAEAGVDPERVLGLGVVSPGPLTAATGLVISRPSLHQWVDYPLKARLEAASGYPVVIDNDATAAAVGEHWTGGAEHSTAFSVLYMATGVGSGTIADGVPYRGASANAGEIGHVCVDINGPECWCGNVGCIEAFAGPSAVVAAAREAGLLGDEPRASDDGGAGSGTDVTEGFAQVARLALAGDDVAAAIMARSARYLAVAAQTLCSVMDVDLLVLTGPAFAVAGDLYLPEVQERASSSFVARGTHGVRVLVSSHANEAAAVGAAALVLQGELVPRRFGVRMRLTTEDGPTVLPAAAV
ncbi:ROK family protein [Antribacter gilvus]|uniref:ROK family protein n=1 Tax=Antribacter gilvus TaxID=2304675 RepID=UPI000F790006|nr:ROK family protein [Antribacter gilvus]